MRSALFTRLRPHAASAALALAACAGLARADFSYFFVFGEPTTEITKRGDAIFDTNGEYRLTTGDGQAGAVWFNTKQSVEGGFVAFVQFVILQQDGDPPPDPIVGDGMALVLSGAATQPTVGVGGSGMGYDGLDQSVAFEIDTFSFNPPTEFAATHASIQKAASGPVTNNDFDSVAHAVLSTLNPPLNVLDFQEHTLVVQYAPPDGPTPASLQMWIDERLVVSSSTDLSGFFDEDGKAWIGLTAGTGIANSVHVVRLWDFMENTGSCAEPFNFAGSTGSGCGLPSGPCQLNSTSYVRGTRPITYTWKRDGQPITNDEGGRIQGLGTPTIVINNATSNDHADYEMAYSNACGNGVNGPFFIATSLFCNSVDFNNDQLTPDSGDLDDYIAVLSGGPTACSTGDCDPLDFNNDGLFPDSLDLEALISRLGGGPCIRE